MDKAFPLQMIREKSKMFQISYENLLIGCARERLLARFLQQPPKNEGGYVFSGVVSLGIERYRYSKVQTLELKILGNVIESTVFQEVEDAFLGAGNNRWKGNWIQKEDTYALLEVYVPFDKVQLPISVRVEASPAGKGAMQTISLPLCYENDNYIEIPCFFPEAELAEAFVECWERMELLNEMSRLEYLYLMGKTFSFDGRRVSEYLEYYFKEKGMTFSKERCQQVFACEKNTYLKKRWKAYLSKEKRNSPSWEEVMGLIRNLYEPVVLVLCEDEIFFGDWMPTVGRYL